MPRTRSSASSQFEYRCARHDTVRADSKLVGLFLCDECAQLFKSRLFSGADPEFSYSAVTGLCSYCSVMKEVREHFWFLCGICERIVRSYPAEQAATAFLSEWWRQSSQSDETLKEIELKRTDPVCLMSFREHQEWRASPHESKPDFTAVRSSTSEKVFAIEMKTGRSSIRKMSAFQLDVSDCDDILSFVNKLKIPSYVFHVQVVEEYSPPTFRKVAVNAWWISVVDMENAFREVRTRQREQRPAAYYRKTAFKPLETFLEHVKGAEFESIRRMLESKTPRLYRLP